MGLDVLLEGAFRDSDHAADPDVADPALLNAPGNEAERDI